jgi:hypothetical protein
MTRVLVTLSTDADHDSVVTELSGLGLGAVAPPAPELPDVAIADVDEATTDDFIAAAQAVPGVVVAERETFSFTQDDFE